MSTAVCARNEADTKVRDRRAREQQMQDLFHANADPLRRYLERMCPGQPEAAEDLLQETMLKAWRKLDHLPEDAESLRRWLFTVSRNVAIDAVRSRMARPLESYSPDGSWALPVACEAERVVDRHMLLTALSELPELHRKVLVSLYCQDTSIADTAALLDIPEGTVRSRAFYALRKVREHLAGQGGC